MKPISLAFLNKDSNQTINTSRSRNLPNNLIDTNYTDYMIIKTGGLQISESKKGELSLKKTIRFIQIKKKEELQNFHKNTILKSFRTSTNANTLISDNTYINTERDTNLNPLLKKNLFYSSISSSASKIESLTEYKSKSQSIRKMNYLMNLNEENIIRIDEEFHNQIDEYKHNIKTCQLNTTYFDNFLFKMNQYLRYLHINKEIEFINYLNVKDSMHRLQRDIAKMKNKQEKSTLQLNRLNEYKLFLICLKEKKIITDINNTNSPKRYFIARTCPNKTHIRRSNFILQRQKKTLSLANKNTRKNSTEKKAIMMAFKAAENKEEMAYDNVEDAMNDIDKLQNQMIGLMTIYNSNVDLISQRTHTTTVYNCEGNYKEVKSLKEKLEGLKDKNKNLLNEKYRISNRKVDDNDEIIFNQIESLHNYLDETKYFKFSKIPKFKKKLFDNTESILIKLRQIEESIFELFIIIEDFKLDSNKKKAIFELEKNIEKKRKINLIINKEKDTQRDNLKAIKDLKDKYEKIVFTHIRKNVPRLKIQMNNYKNYHKYALTDRKSYDFTEYLKY